jgi:hypothetical protein
LYLKVSFSTLMLVHFRHVALSTVRGLSVFAVSMLSFFYKMNSLVLRVFARKPAFFVLDKKSERDFFHAFPESFSRAFSSRVGLNANFVSSVSFVPFLCSRIQLEVSLG